MASIINTNSLSLLTQNNLTKSQGSLNTAIERLSSGMRINSAKDDAAGQAIANRFTANIKGLTQASRNANDGISMAQTTEGALGEINTNLQRIRELAVQSSNATNSSADRTSIQAEITQRLAEITRTSEQTDFNGTKVLNSDQSLKIQVGANDGETISIDLKKMDLSALGISSFNVDGTGTANTAATKDSLLVAGFTANAAAPVNGTQQYDKSTNNVAATSANIFSKLATNDTVAYTGTDTGYGTAATANYTYDAATTSFSFDTTAVANADAIASLTPSATTGASTAATVQTGTGTSTQSVNISSSGNITAADDNATLYLDAAGNLSKTNSANNANGATLTTLVESMNKEAGATGSTVVGTGGSIVSGTTTITAVVGGAAGTAGTFSVVGAKISAAALRTLGDDSAATYTATIATVGGVTGDTYTIAAGGATANGTTNTAAQTTLSSSGALSDQATTETSFFEHSNGAVMDDAGNTVYSDSASAGNFTLDARSGNTSTTDPLAVLDNALSTVDSLRGSLGAVQNRFDSVISNLGTTLTNLASSRSRIEDADYATEVSNMTRANILQQAGTSVLAQANQSTQGVLSLLR